MSGVTTIRPTGVYTLRGVAAELGVSVRTLQRAVAAGALTATRAGPHSFVTGRSLLAWLEGRTGAGVTGDRETAPGG